MLGSKFYQLDHLQIWGDNSYICVCEYINIYTHLSIPGGLDDKASARMR